MSDSAHTRFHLQRTGVALAILVAILLALMGAGIVAGFWPFSSPSLTRRAEAILSKQLQATCSIARFRLTPLRGASFDSVSIVRSLPNDGTLTVNARRMKIVYRPVAMLAQFPAVLRMGAEEASSRLWSAKGSSNASFSERMKSFSRSLAGKVLRSASVTDATLRVAGASGEVIRAHGVTLRAGVPVPSVPEIVAEIDIDSVILNSQWRLSSLSAVASVDGGSLRVIKASALCYGGKIAGRGGVNLDKSRLDSLSLRASKIDVGALYTLARGRGALAGAAHAEITFSPSALKLDSLKGSGDLAVSNFSVRAHPIQKLLLENLLLPSVDNLTFDKVTSRISLEDRTLYATDLKARGDPLSIGSTGYARLDGKIDFSVDGTLSKGFVTALPPVVRDALIPARNGGASFVCRFYGSVDNPAVSVDKSHIDRAVNSVLKSLSQELKRLLR